MGLIFALFDIALSKKCLFTNRSSSNASVSNEPLSSALHSFLHCHVDDDLRVIAGQLTTTHTQASTAQWHTYREFSTNWFLPVQTHIHGIT